MVHEDFGGLLRDLRATGASMDRRALLRMAASMGALSLMGCGGSSTTDPNDDGNGNCSRIPEETAGPFRARDRMGPTY